MKELKYYKNQLTFADIGIKDKRKKITPELLEEMKKLREQKVSYQKIANKFKVSYNFVYLNLNKDYYNNVFKKIQKKYYSNLNPEAKERMKERSRKYNERRRRIFNSIDYKKYLSPLPQKNTIKKQILDILTEDRLYRYSEIKIKINKDYPSFSRALRELEREGKVKLSGSVGKKAVRIVR